MYTGYLNEIAPGIRNTVTVFWDGWREALITSGAFKYVIILLFIFVIFGYIIKLLFKPIGVSGVSSPPSDRGDWTPVFHKKD